MFSAELKGEFIFGNGFAYQSGHEQSRIDRKKYHHQVYAGASAL